MPHAAKTPCKSCGRAACGKLCEECVAAGRGKEDRRGSTERLYDYRWQQARAAYLAAHPLCVGYPHGFHGAVVTVAECVDHIIAPRGDHDLFWDEANWQSLCIACNSRKAVEQEGALGRRRRVVRGDRGVGKIRTSAT